MSQRVYNKYIVLILCVSMFITGCASNQRSADTLTNSSSQIAYEDSSSTFSHVDDCVEYHNYSPTYDDQIDNSSVDWDDVGKAAAIAGFCVLVVALVALDVAIIAASKGRGRMVCTRTAWCWCD